MERSGIKDRVSQADSLEPSKVQKSAVKGQLEDQGWVKRKERDHASVRCQASRMGFKPGQEAELPSLIYQTPQRRKSCLLHPLCHPETSDWLSQRIYTPNLNILAIVFKSSETMKRSQEFTPLNKYLPDVYLLSVSYFQKPALPRVLLSPQFDKS